MKRKHTVTFGVLLIIFGLFFLAKEIAPQYFPVWEWPFYIIGLGGIFIIWAITSGVGRLAIPGTTMAGIGSILFYLEHTGGWRRTSISWALIPSFIGLGVIIAGLIDRNFKSVLVSGLTMFLISGITFFALGINYGLPPEITKFWPILLILFGILASVCYVFGFLLNR